MYIILYIIYTCYVKCRRLIPCKQECGSYTYNHIYIWDIWVFLPFPPWIFFISWLWIILKLATWCHSDKTLKSKWSFKRLINNPEFLFLFLNSRYLLQANVNALPYTHSFGIDWTSYIVSKGPNIATYTITRWLRRKSDLSP